MKKTQVIKNKAFTLAETLIVIGIIGVVAALTLPNLNHATGDKEKVTRVKKMYSALTEAFDRAEAIYGSFDEWFINLSEDVDYNERAAKRITEFMKISKDCGAESGCFSNYDDNGAVYKVVAADSSSIGFKTDGETILIVVDIDGDKKGKNNSGDDEFYFVGRIENGTYVMSPMVDKDISFADLVKAAYEKDSGACTAWILNYDNADYLKFTDENGTCQNGNVVTESNPSCN